MSVQTGADKWEEWNSRGGPKYPHEKVVQFTFRNFPADARSSMRVLDLGCGSGVHARFFASEGFQVYGTDISRVGVEHTTAALTKHGLRGEFKVESVERIGYRAESFDCVICVGVLDCAGPSCFAPAVSEIVRVLRPGGVAMLLFASDCDFRVQGAGEYGLHGFSDAEVAAVRPLIDGYLEHFWMDRYITTYQNKLIQQNDHLVTLRKAGR